MNDFTEFAPLKYDAEAIKRQGWGMASSGAKDDGLIVGFYKKSVLNHARSTAEGKPVYEGKDFVKIEHPGEGNINRVDRPIQETDKYRWPRQWSLYEAGVTQTPDGIPLSLLFPAKPQVVETMRGYNIHTVEQLSKLSAQAISTVGMGCQEWVNAAQRYMEQANKGINHHQFEKEMANRDQEIATLRRQLNEVTALVRSQATSQQPPQNTQAVDFQTQQINAVHQSNEPYTPAPAQFVQDLSGQVQPQRRGPGRPRKNQEH